MTCPACSTELHGLGRYCDRCGEYVADMDVTSLSLTLPLPPNMANGRMHWAEKSRRQKDYRLECDTMTGPLPSIGVRVRLDATMYLWSLMDEDNLIARLKWVQDWLVWADVIPDDSSEYLTLGKVGQAIDRKRQRVEITLEAA